MFSFRALLSTDLSDGYSQGLIHGKVPFARISGASIPLKQTESARHWGIYSRRKGQTGANGLSVNGGKATCRYRSWRKFAPTDRRS